MKRTRRGRRGEPRARRARVGLATSVTALAVAMLAITAGTAGVAAAHATSAPATSAPATARGGHASQTAVDLAARGKLGDILVTGTGFTLYHPRFDKPNQNNCTGTCAMHWPPLLLAKGQAEPVAGPGVTGLGVVMLVNGTDQVTWHKRALYTYSKDTKAGETKGEGVGGVWWVVKPPQTTVDLAARGKLGDVLVTGTGFTLYHPSFDKPNQNNCTGACAKTWPPLLLANGQAEPVAGPGVSGLGVIMLANGTDQVTWNKKALYTYSKDSKAGQTNGEGVGGVWFVVKPPEHM